MRERHEAPSRRRVSLLPVYLLRVLVGGERGHRHRGRQQQIVLVELVQEALNHQVALSERAGVVGGGETRALLDTPAPVPGQRVIRVVQQMAVHRVGVAAEEDYPGVERRIQLQRRLLHRAAQFLERPRARFGYLRHLRVNRRVAEVSAPAYPESLNAALGRGHEIGNRLPERTDVARVIPRHDLEKQRRVAHRSRHRPLLADEVGDRRRGDARVAGHAALRRLDAVYAVEAGGYANRAAAVSARAKRAQPRRDGRARAAAGAARSALRVPGIARRFAEPVLAGAQQPELRRVRLAQHDGARAQNVLHAG